MKHIKHEQRKSFKKWALTGQLTSSITTHQHKTVTSNKDWNGRFGDKSNMKLV